MDKNEFKRIARLLKEAYKNVQKQADRFGISKYSDEFQQMIDDVRVETITRAGYSVEEYELAKEDNSGVSNSDMVQFVEQKFTELNEEVKRIDSKSIPSEDQIKKLAEEIAKKYVVPPQVINKIVDRVTIKEPKIVKETIKINERVEYDDSEIKSKIKKIDEKIDEKIGKIKVVDENKLREELKSHFNESLEKNINILDMPNFRKLGMGLQAQIDELRTNSGGTNYVFNNANGVTFGTNGSTVTASHNGITSQTVQPVAISGSNGSFNFSTLTFGNSNGLTFYTTNGSMVGSYTVPNVPAQTEFVFSNSNNVSFGTNGSTVTATATFNQSIQTQNLVSIENSTGNIHFSNSNGITFGFNNSTITASHNGLTTAAQSNHSHNFATTTTNGASIIVGTANSAGITVGVPAYLTTAQPVGAYLTTARASNDGVGLNTAQSNVTWTVNSGGLSFDARGYAGTGTTFNGTNISGSMTLNSNGLRFDASVAAPGAGGGAALKGSGTYTQNTGTIEFANSNGITFGLSNNGTMTASHNGLTTARASNDAVGLNTAATNVTWTVNSSGISLNGAGYAGTGTSATNASITLNSNGLAVSVAAPGAGGGATMDIFANFELGVGSAQQFAFSNINARTNSVIVQPLMGNYDAFPGNITANTVYLKASMSASTATMSSAHTVSVFLGVYTNNANTLSLANSVSTSWGSNAGNANLSTVFAGVRWLSIHSSAWSSQPVFTQGHYYWGLMLRTAGQSYNVSAAFAGNTIFGSASATASGTIGVATVASNTSRGMGPWYGVYSAATAALPTVINSNGLNKVTDVAIFNPYILMVRSGPTTF